jgi:hypothetical protein
MKPCCITTAQRHLKKARSVATCDGCGHLLMAYSDARDLDEVKKALTAQGTPFEEEAVGGLRVIAKPRYKRR